MRICIDNISPGLATSHKTIGGMRDYLYHFVKYLLMYDHENEYTVISPKWNDSVFVENGTDVNEKFIPCPVSRSRRIIFENTLFPHYVNSLNPDLYVGLHNSFPPFLKCKRVFFVKSIQYLTSKEEYSFGRRHYLIRKLLWSIKNADKAIVPTSYSKEFLIDKCGLDAYKHKIEVIPEAPYINSSYVDEVRKKSALDKSIRDLVGGSDYFLTVGALYRYKNTELIIESFSSFLKNTNLDYKLLIIGSADTKTLDHYRSICQHNGVFDRVFFLGQREREFIVAAYLRAKLFLFFSKYETFGHPLIEAMIAKCPILTTNNDLHSEITGGCSFHIDSANRNDIALYLKNVLGNERELSNVANRGFSWVSRYSWEKVAGSFIRMIEDL